MSVYLQDATWRVRSGAWGPRPPTPHPPASTSANADDNRPQNDTGQEQARDHLKTKSTFEREQLERDAAAKLAHARAARARGSDAAKAEEASRELRFREAWLKGLDEKHLQPREGLTATERLAALRDRLALKARL